MNRRDYFNKYYQDHIKVFDSDKRHRTTRINRTSIYWVKCYECEDKDTCYRHERHTTKTCEQGIKIGYKNYYMEQLENKAYSNLSYKLNLR